MATAQTTPTSTATNTFDSSIGSQSTPASIEQYTAALDSEEFNSVFEEKSVAKKAPSDVYEMEENTKNILLDKIAVETGEEDENVLFSSRAELYRFRDPNWKLRGMGDVKILQYMQTGQLR